MADLVNTRVVKILGVTASAVIIILNFVLIWQTLGLPVPGLMR
jgi:energy-converting hydrogenase Eha subunit B